MGFFVGYFHGISKVMEYSWEQMIYVPFHGNPLDFCCVHQNAQQYSERPSPHRQVYNPKVFDCGTYEKPRIHEDHFDEQHHS